MFDHQCSHKVRVQVEGRGQVPGVVLLCRPTIHHKESDPILEKKHHIKHSPFVLSTHMANLRKRLIIDSLVEFSWE